MSCGVCKRPPNEVKKLVTIARGSTSFLMCDRCIGEANQALTVTGKPKEMVDEPLPIPKVLKDYLSEYVVSQDHAKEDLAIAVYNHYKRRLVVRNKIDLGVELQKSNIMLMGPSGCGKTELIRAIAKKLKVPLYIGDATRLTSAGYVGDDVDTLLRGLCFEADGDVERAQWGIVFLDEADKIARKSGKTPSGHKDISGEAVQQALLKLIEGSKVSISLGKSPMDMSHVEVSTDNILFIFAGSFAGIEDIVHKRLNRGAIGFTTNTESRKDVSNVFPLINEDDLLEFGFIPELLGRLPIRTYVNPLTEEELYRILTEPKNSLVRQYKALFGIDNVKLEFDPEAIREIAQEAQTRKSGARALRSIIERVLKPFSFAAPGNPDLQEILVTPELVRNSC